MPDGLQGAALRNPRHEESDRNTWYAGTDTNNLAFCNIAYSVEELVCHGCFDRMDRRRFRFVPVWFPVASNR